jgi:hypothetical protein
VEYSGAVVIFRCTKKLLERARELGAPDRDPPPSTTFMGDWSANFVQIGRKRVVLAVNNRTLLPVIVPVSPPKTLLPRFTQAVGEMLTTLGVDGPTVTSELAAMDERVVSTSNDRRVTGILVDFASLLDSYLDARPLVEVALHLADAPCSPLSGRAPLDATQDLFGLPRARRVKG